MALLLINKNNKKTAPIDNANTDHIKEKINSFDHSTLYKFILKSSIKKAKGNVKINDDENCITAPILKSNEGQNFF